jgi:hypothetical protein
MGVMLLAPELATYTTLCLGEWARATGRFPTGSRLTILLVAQSITTTVSELAHAQ